MRVHMEAHKAIGGKVHALDTNTEEGHALRQTIIKHYQEHDGENTDHGIEMGYRYKSGIVIPDGTKEPKWTPSEYVPTTFPGSRAPHVFLRDGTAIFDLCGMDYNLVEFVDEARSDGG